MYAAFLASAQDDGRPIELGAMSFLALLLGHSKLFGRYSLPFALMLLASPAQAETILATITGGIGNSQSQKIETTFEFGTGNVNGGFHRIVPLVEGTTSFTDLSVLSSQLFGAPVNREWQFVMPGVVGKWAPGTVGMDFSRTWTDFAHSYMDGGGTRHIESIKRVDSLNGINLAGTAHILSRLDFTLSDVTIETLDFGGTILYGHSAEFELNLWSAVPEPATSGLLIALCMSNPVWLRSCRRSSRGR